jgi:8-oxo-dGTP diphosphatase
MAELAASTEVLAAGAVVWRTGAHGTEVALVHRPKYDDWSFPKGKCDPGEHAVLAAVREVHEETGLLVTLGRPLGTTGYQVRGRPKRVDYWAARSPDRVAPFEPNREIDELSWLPAGKARARLSYERDQEVLDRLLAGPADTWPFILLRHASAGSKSDWDGADLDRPLDPAGAADARLIARLLSCYAAGRVISSAAERCVATVRPYAAATGAAIELDPLFTVPDRSDGSLSWPAAQAGSADARSAAERAAALAADELPAVVCVHRENLPLLLAAACEALRSRPPDGSALDKGAFWVLHHADGRLAAAEQQHPVPA